MATEDLVGAAGQPQSPDRRAFEWGLGSLVISAALTITAPITLGLAVGIWSFSCHDIGPVCLHAWLARVGVAAALIMAVGATGFGTKAVRCALTRKQPAGVAVAGLSLSIAAFILWVITAIALLNTTESLLLNCR